MGRIIGFILVVSFFLCPVFSQPKREIRAVWLTTAYGLDWPSVRATDVQGRRKQQEELCRMLDRLQEANFNTVLFQTRVRGDVLYSSDIEPYSEVLTGKGGEGPGYDPLSFTIEECHRRGMELHAWIVCIPLGEEAHVRRLGRSSVVHKRPELCKRHNGRWFLDPGNPATKVYLRGLVRELVSAYDVDGVHLDYIRYPEHPEGFPDKDSYRKYGREMSLADWRRNNITAIVRDVYRTVKECKPWVKVSSAPVGKFRDTSRYSSLGWNAYHSVYQDAQGWLREGIQDALFPMMYYRGDQFYPFALDWHENSYGKAVVPGLGVYFLQPSGQDWGLEEIDRQVNFVRKEGLSGQAYYRAAFVAGNVKGLLDRLACDYYPYPALPVALPGHDEVLLSAPSALLVEEHAGETVLRWASSDEAVRYAVYASDRYPVDVSDAANLLAANLRENAYTYLYIYPERRKRFFAVTALDAYGNESEARQSDDGNRMGLLHSDGNVLFLPSVQDACHVTITDLSGRFLLHTSYHSELPLDGVLQQGCYRLLLSDSLERTSEYVLHVQYP